jgi:predicted SnoaL-like aldol condensation-catalyzing enzyme
MRTLLNYSVCLGLVFALGACSSDDDDTGAGAPAAGGTGGGGGSSSTVEPAPADAPVDGDTAADPSEPAAADAAPVALSPALPVVENPDHAALLASDVPALAANKRLVYDMWRTLIEARDTAAAEQYFAEDYIQHNPNADTGRAGVLAFFASQGAPLAIEDRVQTPLVSIVAEGDYVALVQVDARTEPRAYTTTWFDLFRIEDGVIAEHWDHGRLPADGTPSGYVPPVEHPDQQAALASDDAALASNKQLVHDMWRTLLDAQQVEEAPRYLAEGYVQHNPQANTGLQGFLAFFRQFAQPQPVQPGVRNFIQMIAEDDLVVLATVRTYDDATGTPYTTTWFDMFRVGDGKLVEHWDTATIE